MARLAPGEHAHTYRLGGPTCLAGDEIGEYSFREPLAIGDRVVFEDMACYTMVKNTMFNGVTQPAIAIQSKHTGEVSLVREFGYESAIVRVSPRAEPLVPAESPSQNSSVFRPSGVTDPIPVNTTRRRIILSRFSNILD